MAATLPLQEPGPGPTAQPLPSWLSYSAVTTLTSPYLSTVTRIVYYPDGSFPPTPTLQVDEGTQTSVQYSVIYRPLLYDGPFPAPPLGTLFTTEGQRVMPSQSEGMGNTPQPTQTAAPAPAPGMTPGDGQGNGVQGGQDAGNGQGGNGQAGNGQGTAGQGDAGQGGNNAQGGQPQDGGAGQAGSGNEQGQGGQAGQGTNGQGQPTQGGAQGDNGAGTGSSVTAGVFPIGTTGADGVFSPTATATAFPPGATPTDAAGSSSAAAAESSASASLASSISASLSSQSAASASSTLTSSAQPSETGVAGVNSTPDSGLSGGQIAGIVIGALLALLLLLLALLCCWRRRRRREEEADRAAGLTGGSMRGPGHQRRQLSDRWAAGFSRGGAGDAAQGTYAAIGAAGAGAGAAGAAAGARENSDEWEEDQLRSGGSGFFVVGGREGRSDSIPTVASTVQRNRGAKRSALEALGLGAAGGIVAAAIGRRRSGNRGASQPVPTDEADVLSDEEGEGEDVGEKRGLMSFDESNAEMSEAGNRQSWIAPTAAAAAAAGAGGAGAYAAARQSNEDPFDEKTALAAQQHGEEQGQDLGSPSATRRTMTPSTSASSSAAAAPGWGTTAAVAGVAAAAGGAAAAGHRRNSDSLGGGYTTSGGYTSSQSGAGSRSGSGSGSRGGHAPSSRGGGTSTNSTGTRTVQGSPTTQQSLPPPPRAPRDRHGVTTYGNVAPAAGVNNEASNASGKPRIPSFSGAAFGEGLGFDPARPSMDSSAGGGSSNDHAGLYLGVAGAAGLGALAAGHRESGGSSYSKGAYATDEEEAQRHSRFISQNTPLLGPGASEDTRTQQQQQHLTPYAATGPATNYGHGRLPTIKSVGEFGEGGSGVHSLGSTGSSGGYARASLLSPTSEEQQAQTPVSIGTAAASAAGGAAGAGTFYTPPGSPRGTLGQARSMRSVESSGGAPGRLGGATGLAQGSTDDEDAANPFADRSTSAHEYTDQRDDETSASGHGHQAQLGAAAAAGGGLLGGLAAGWRRLTMGNTSSDPALVAERERELASPTRASDEAARDFSPRSHAARRDPAQASDPGLAAEVQSMRASVHQSSTLGHASPASGEAHSRATSGDPSPTLPSSDEQQRLSSAASSGERLAVAGAAGAALGAGVTTATQQHGSGAASQRSSQPSTGYSASISGVSNNTSSRSRSGPEGSRRSVLSGASTGLDSLSQRAHVSEHSSSGTRSSGSRRTAASESGASTGAASYSPSVLRNSTTSTRGGATTAAGRRVPVPYEVTMEEEEDEGYESEGQSSRATAGNNSSLGGGRKRPRSGSLDGAVGAGAARQLDSLREVQEAPIEDLYGHYPSASLGAAAMRQAYREAELQQAGAGAAGVSHSPQSSTSQTRTPRPLPRSLVAGIAAAPSRANVQHTLSTSASTPSLREPTGAAGASSSAWRESPRVASASMRAAEAAAFLEASRAQQQQQQAAWGDLEATFPAASRPSGLRNEEGAVEQQQQQQQEEEEARTSQWPKFLRF